MKLHSIRIQNYKSIKDITLYLSDVNLLIGPNNSGKSNILSALKLFSDYIYYLKHQEYPANSDFTKEIYFIKDKSSNDDLPINIITTFINEESKYFVLSMSIFCSDEIGVSQFFSIHKSQVRIEDYSSPVDLKKQSNYLETGNLISYDMLRYDRDRVYSENSFLTGATVHNNLNIDFTKSIKDFSNSLFEFFSSSSIYNIQVEKLKSPAKLNTNEDSILPDGSNLVSFIDSMRDTKPGVIKEIEKDLFRFTKEFNSIRLIKVTDHTTSDNSPTLKKIGLADKDDNTFWADELSEGVLYFLALLAIIHQPNPPRLLMLEEPEKGIHPRRIKEIIELIFYLAKEKQIRVILTTHSTYVVDEFAEVPEGVHIIDKIDKSTQVKNLKLDFIDKEEGRDDKIDYSSNLGEHWAIGFLGGVPE